MKLIWVNKIFLRENKQEYADAAELNQSDLFFKLSVIKSWNKKLWDLAQKLSFPFKILLVIVK